MGGKNQVWLRYVEVVHMDTQDLGVVLNLYLCLGNGSRPLITPSVMLLDFLYSYGTFRPAARKLYMAYGQHYFVLVP